MRKRARRSLRRSARRRRRPSWKRTLRRRKVRKSSRSGSPAAWKGLGKDRKLVLTAHNSFWPMGRPPRGLKRRLRTALLSSQAAALDAAICTSGECARQVSELTRGRIRGKVERPQLVRRYPVERRERVRKLLFRGWIETSKGVFLPLDAFERR